MSPMTKVFVVLNALLGIVLSVLTVGAAAQWTNWKDLAQKHEEARAAETTLRMNLESTMIAALSMKDDVLRQKDEDLAKLKQTNSDLATEVARVKLDATRAEQQQVASEASRKKIEEILNVTAAQLTANQNLNQQLQTQNNDYQTRLQQLVARVQELTSNNTILNDEQRNLREKLYAAEQQLSARGRAGAERGAQDSPEGAKPVAPPVAGAIQGEITEVKGTYATLNIGETSGVVKGLTFMIYRGSTYVADLEIETVRPKECGGRLKYMVQDVRAGDRARYGVDSASR